MSKEKQIEEMATDINEVQNGGWEFVGDSEYTTDVHNEELAEHLYNAGYRKQSEVIRCKDCEHFYQDGNIKLCRHWNCHSTEDDAYCSYAKMKGGEDNA